MSAGRKRASGNCVDKSNINRTWTAIGRSIGRFGTGIEEDLGSRLNASVWLPAYLSALFPSPSLCPSVPALSPLPPSLSLPSLLSLSLAPSRSSRSLCLLLRWAHSTRRLVADPAVFLRLLLPFPSASPSLASRISAPAPGRRRVQVKVRHRAAQVRHRAPQRHRRRPRLDAVRGHLQS